MLFLNDAKGIWIQKGSAKKNGDKVAVKRTFYVYSNK